MCADTHRGYLFSTFAKFSVKLTFLTSCLAQIIFVIITIENGEVIDDESEIGKLFHKYFVKLLENQEHLLKSKL